MRILFDSRQPAFKDPVGTLMPGQSCSLHIHVPKTVVAVSVQCVFTPDDGTPPITVELLPEKTLGAYQVFGGSFCINEPNLYFYHFVVTKKDGSFRLFKAGSGTNMEAGDQWQLTCTPADFTVPEWAKGAVIYQVFPDRFRRSGDCDLTGKLEPYTVHENWNEEVDWAPTPEGLVLNNDFYGGNFRGIAEKMDYIASLGTTILYLNPISKSFSSHRYDTGDYKTPDPMLGTLEDFKAMCDAAHARGIRVILDGVYSHTGSDSLYFDKNRNFGGNGAYCSKNSPYYSWYQFRNWPDQYKAWWDFDTLPTVNKLDPGFMEYIITGEDSVIAHWLKWGCDGFRLDVADELPNAFMDTLKKHLRKLRPDALLLGEVWEDASNKIAYGIRTRYFVDGTMDSVMNYPFRTAILNFLRHADDGAAFREAVMTVVENYPEQVLHCNMNLLGTHDTPRILTALVENSEGSRQELAKRFLTPEQKTLALERLYMASFLQYMLPGSPSLYYGDEALMEGHKDPFNRRTFPWGQENVQLTNHYRHLGKLKQQPALKTGATEFIQAGDGRIGFTRSCDSQKLRIYVNHSRESWEIPAGKLLYGRNLQTTAPDWLTLAPMGMCVTEEV